MSSIKVASAAIAALSAGDSFFRGLDCEADLLVVGGVSGAPTSRQHPAADVPATFDSLHIQILIILNKLHPPARCKLKSLLLSTANGIYRSNRAYKKYGIIQRRKL